MKKESYKHNLPHFQQSGQSYFVTWILKDAVPPKALHSYTQKLKQLKSQIEIHKQRNSEKNIIVELQGQYNLVRKKYIRAYDDLLALNKKNIVDLSKTEYLEIIIEAIHFWEGKKLKSIAYSIMPNHVHWVLELFDKDETGNPVYLQDILQSVKRHTANRINKLNGRTGTLWQKESFDTTIRDEKHLYYAVNIR